MYKKKKNKKQMKYFKEFSVNEADELNEDFAMMAYTAMGLIGTFNIYNIPGQIKKWLYRLKIKTKWTLVGVGVSKMQDILKPIAVRFSDDIELIKIMKDFKDITFIKDTIQQGYEDPEEMAKYKVTFRKIWDHIKDGITPEEKMALQKFGMGDGMQQPQ